MIYFLEVFKIQITPILALIFWGNLVFATEKFDSQSIDEKLDLAYTIQSKDPEKFKSLMSSLKGNSANFSSYQHCFYRYLHGYDLGFKGEISTMVKFMNDLFQECNSLDNKIRIKLTLANIYVISREYEKAFQDLSYVLDNIESITNSQIKDKAYSAAAIVYRLSGQHEESLQYADLLIEEGHTESDVCKGKYNKLRVLLSSSYSEQMQEQVLEAVDYCSSSGNFIESHFLSLDLIKQQLELFKSDNVLMSSIYQDLKDLRVAVMKTEYHNLVVYYQSVLAIAAWHSNHRDEARTLGRQAIELNNSLGNTIQQNYVLDMLIKDALDINDGAKAFEYLQLKYAAEKQVYDLKSAQSLAYYRVKHNNMAKVLEIEQLNKLNEVLELEQRLVKQKANNQRLWIMLLLTLFGFGLFGLYKMKKRQDHFKDVSEVDHLTKVLTRKAFEEQMAVMITKMEAKAAPIFITILDLDHFKLVNDNHGHLTGDWVLKNVIYACKELIEANMIIARLGGEEFCVVMPDMSLEAVSAKIEASRHAIESMDYSGSGADISVTASFGVTSTVKSGYNLNQLLSHADEALFKAKEQGRNQIVFY